MPTKEQLNRQREIEFKYPEFRRDGDPMKATFKQAEERRKTLWPEKYGVKDKKKNEDNKLIV